MQATSQHASCMPAHLSAKPVCTSCPTQTQYLRGGAMAKDVKIAELATWVFVSNKVLRDEV